jgi:polyphosphate kinase
MEDMLQDNRQAWDLGADGRYTQRTPVPGEPDRGSHRVLAESWR